MLVFSFFFFRERTVLSLRTRIFLAICIAEAICLFVMASLCINFLTALWVGSLILLAVTPLNALIVCWFLRDAIAAIDRLKRENQSLQQVVSIAATAVQRRNDSMSDRVALAHDKLISAKG